MTKKDIVKAIATELRISQGLAHKIVQRTFEMIIEALVRQQRIELRDFGVFEVRVRAPRKARNPRTNERVDVPSRAVVTFKAGKEMEDRVAALRPDQVTRLLHKHLARPPRGTKAVPERPEERPRPSERDRPEH